MSVSLGPPCADTECPHVSCYVEPGQGLLDNDLDVALGPLVDEAPRRVFLYSVRPIRCSGMTCDRWDVSHAHWSDSSVTYGTQV